MSRKPPGSRTAKRLCNADLKAPKIPSLSRHENQKNLSTFAQLPTSARISFVIAGVIF
jgi:hypothetical protein